MARNESQMLASVTRLQRVASTSLCGAVALLVAVPATAQVPHKEDRLVKETREDGGLILDESGLTRTFEQMNAMIRVIDKEMVAGGEVEVHCGRLPAISADFKTFAALESGVVEFEYAAAIKMRTATSLRFGSVDVATGNVAENYPGLYSLWIRKVSPDDWRLVFNRESDAWGTMHDPQADVGEVKLTHEFKEDANSLMVIGLEDTSDKGGNLVLAWGPHSWTVPFTAVH